MAKKPTRAESLREDAIRELDQLRLAINEVYQCLQFGGVDNVHLRMLRGNMTKVVDVMTRGLEAQRICPKVGPRGGLEFSAAEAMAEISKNK